jgi:hypothetical protein
MSDKELKLKGDQNFDDLRDVWERVKALEKKLEEDRIGWEENIEEVLRDDYKFKVDKLPENELKKHYEELLEKLDARSAGQTEKRCVDCRKYKTEDCPPWPTKGPDHWCTQFEPKGKTEPEKEPVVEPTLDLWEKNTITVTCPYCHQSYYLAPKSIEERVRDATRKELTEEFLEDLDGVPIGITPPDERKYHIWMVPLRKKWEGRVK